MNLLVTGDSLKKYINKKLKGDCFDGVSFASTLLGDDNKSEKALIIFIGNFMKQIRWLYGWEIGTCS